MCFSELLRRYQGQRLNVLFWPSQQSLWRNLFHFWAAVTFGRLLASCLWQSDLCQISQYAPWASQSCRCAPGLLLAARLGCGDPQSCPHCFSWYLRNLAQAAISKWKHRLSTFGRHRNGFWTFCVSWWIFSGWLCLGAPVCPSAKAVACVYCSCKNLHWLFCYLCDLAGYLFFRHMRSLHLLT